MELPDWLQRALVTQVATEAKDVYRKPASHLIAEEPYQPRQEWTDDYPHIDIALHVGAGEIGRGGGIALLFTESQGEFHAPWGACISGRMWTASGETIGRALAELNGSLKRATLNRMMREVDR